MNNEKINELISQMTLEEKASLCSGKDAWHTQDIARLAIPSSRLSDGPHGLRKTVAGTEDNLGLVESIDAVCFPAGCATAASFNRDLLVKMGEVIGNECQAEEVDVILGPAVNIKRSPLCGRNFEYYSEDPLLATEMAGALIEGVQSKNIGTSIKHFLANNQETRRMTVSAEVDERALREIYLAAFEGAVKKSKPWTVMCSYNRINGTYAAENHLFLTKILREEWGFDGYVMSDWGAVNDRPADLAAGLELEMPSSYGINDALIVKAVQEGRLKEADVDEACRRILKIAGRCQEKRDRSAVFDREKDHAAAKEIAYETIVLLKNDQILPLKETDKIAMIGHYAMAPRYQGGGSSHINSHKVTSVQEALKDKPMISFARGYDDRRETIDEALLAEALQAAEAADVAVFFAGLPDHYESEGYDREHMRLPAVQNEIIEQIAAVQPNIVVVLHNGSPVEMPWIDKVKGLLETYLSGEAVGEACADLLFGKVSPSARLPETFPLRLEDNPSYLNFPGDKERVVYQEGIFVGYRYYDKKKLPVLFPFGFGLSYTEFQYSDLKLSADVAKDTDVIRVSVDVTNTGGMKGKEVVQLYVAKPVSAVNRPEQELRDFNKIELLPGETRTVSFELGKRAFAYWDVDRHDWCVEAGEYEIRIGKSSRDIVKTGKIEMRPGEEQKVMYHMNSTLGDMMKDERAKTYLQELLKNNTLAGSNDLSAAGEKEQHQDISTAMLNDLPVRALVSFSGGKKTFAELQEILDQINRQS